MIYLFYRANIESKNNEIMKIAMAFDKVKSIDIDIRQHIERNIPLEKQKKEEAIKKLDDKLKQIQSDRQTTTKRIECLKDEIAKEEVRIADKFLMMMMLICYLV